jgi:hypothetical protein
MARYSYPGTSTKKQARGPRRGVKVPVLRRTATPAHAGRATVQVLGSLDWIGPQIAGFLQLDIHANPVRRWVGRESQHAVHTPRELCRSVWNQQRPRPLFVRNGSRVLLRQHGSRALHQPQDRRKRCPENRPPSPRLGRVHLLGSVCDFQDQHAHGSRAQHKAKRKTFCRFVGFTVMKIGKRGSSPMSG